MRRRIFAWWIALSYAICCVQPAGAVDKDEKDPLASDSTKADIHELDSLTSQWYHAHPYGINSLQDEQFVNHEDDSLNREYPDSVYLERISKIPSVIPLTYNQIVKNFIRVYTVKKRDKMERILGMIDYYFPVFEQVLDYYGLPDELKFLPVIESALTPNAVSRAGATGLWQFMYNTGKMYDLEINSLVDERRDPIASSHAAARFLKDLYEIYGDWTLVIAAYNCGPGNVNKAIYRAHGARNYWDIYYFLPRETRGYVPAFIAACYVINYYQYHNLQPVKTDKAPLLTDTLHISDKLHLKQVSGVLDIPLDQLRDMNPQYRKDIIPGNANSYLKLPAKHIANFISYRDSIFAYRDLVFFNPDELRSKPNYYTRHSPATPKGKAKLYYTVKNGDNLGYIAEWYDVRASQLRYWNNIRGNLIRSGQRLVVFVPQSKVSYYKKINDMSFVEKQKLSGGKISSQMKKSIEDGEVVFYHVKHGDTLWEIARRFPGVTDHDIMRLNNINNASGLKPGQKLKIVKP